MDKPGYFQTALSNFATDVACGGAIRHLTDIGYTLDQIVERLDYPAPRAKVQRIMMSYLYESGVLLREEPSAALFAGREAFIQEQDAYGRRSIRRIDIDHNSQFEVTKAPDSTRMSQNEKRLEKREILWKEFIYQDKRDGKLTELLYRKCKENGESYSYASCDFGFLNIDQDGYNAHKEDKMRAQKLMACLNNRQQDYLKGIHWEPSVVYHRLNQRMLEIVGKLYEAGVYSGTCYFAVSQEKVRGEAHEEQSRNGLK